MSARDAARQLRYLLEPLDPWRLNPNVDEIAINRPNEVFVRENGRFVRHAVDIDYDHAYDIAVLAGALNQQNVNETVPLLGTDLPDGERLQAVLPPCVPTGTVSLTLRLHEPAVAPLETVTERYVVDRWNKWKDRKATHRADNATLLDAYDSGDVEDFFREAVRIKSNILLAGPTGAGKSTFLKTLVSVVGEYERVITIENALELKIINQPNHVHMLYSHGGQSTANVSQRDLLEAYLRMRPDRGFVGEMRDPDAAYTFVNEVTTGHRGSCSTIHGRDATQAAVRLFNLFHASPEGRSYDKDTIVMLLEMAIDVIVPFHEAEKRFAMGEVWVGVDAERRGTGFRELVDSEP